MKSVVVGSSFLEMRVPTGPGIGRGMLPGQADGVIDTAVGGRGITMARTLSALGHDVYLVSQLGEDIAAAAVDSAAYHFGFNTVLCPRTSSRTARAVSLLGVDGGHHTYLDAVDEEVVSVDEAAAADVLATASTLVVDASALALQLLPAANEAGVPIVADLELWDSRSPLFVDHVLASADVITAQVAGFELSEMEHARELVARSQARIVTVCLGRHGVLVAGDGLEDPLHVLPPDRAGSAGSAAFAAAMAHYAVVLRCTPVDAARHALVAAGRALAEQPSGEWSGTQLVEPPDPAEA